MSKRMSWGLGVLIVLVIAGVSYMFAVQSAEIRQLEKELAEAKQLLKTGINQPTGVNKSNTRPGDIVLQNYQNKPDDGHEYVWHGDHWCRVEDTASSPVPTAAELRQRAYDSLMQTDLPDELPAELPTESELRQMSSGDLVHLYKLYMQEVMDLRKTDYEASVKLHNTIVPRIAKIQDEMRTELVEYNKAQRKSLPKLPKYRPATEELPAMIFEEESTPTEGGKE